MNTTSGKMSKSKGEFLTVSLLEEKGYDPLSYRFFCLQSHYRKSLVFSWENLTNAQGAYQKLLRRVAALSPEGEADGETVKAYREKFLQQVGNDLNTSMGVTLLYDALKAPASDATKRAILADFDQVLSLSLLDKAAKEREKLLDAGNAASETILGASQADAFLIKNAQGRVTEEIGELLLRRDSAKKAKDYGQADRIRGELNAMGIQFKDIPGGVELL